MDTNLTRTLVAVVERELTTYADGLTADTIERLSALRASWAELVQHLALGPAPELRNCPACDGMIMMAATRCVHCWSKSTAPDVTLAMSPQEPT